MRNTLFLSMFALYSMSMQAQFHGGSGTADDPYLVADGYDLADIANYRTAFYKQTADIDLTEWINDNAPQLGWMPIGTKDAPFEGSYDGGNYTIRGAVINRPSMDYVGIFGYVKDNKNIIQNIIVESPDIIGGTYTGGIIGYSYCVVKDCQISSAKVKGNSYVGGICGRSSNKIENCQVMALNILSSSTCCGGIAGYSDGSISGSVAIVNLIKGENQVGGIAGTINNSIINCYVFANVSSNGDAGGICGYGYYGHYNLYTGYYSSDGSYPTQALLQINNCFFDGEVRAKNSGGIIGKNYGATKNTTWGSHNSWYKYRQEGLLTRSCLVRNAIIAAKECAGGIQAKDSVPSSEYNVENCVSLATIVSSQTTDVAARIVNNTYGKNNKAYNQTELYHSNKKVMTINDDAMNGTAYGEKTLMRSSSYTGLGWDFNTVWTIQEGESYPYLQIQSDYPIVTEVSSSNKAIMRGTCKSNGILTIINNGTFVKTQILDGKWEADLGAVNSGDTLYVFAQSEGKMPSVVVKYVFNESSVNPGDDGTPGDANGDGVVDTADVTAIINYILGKPSASFNKENADVNGDGEILIDDAVQTVQMIMDAQ